MNKKFIANWNKDCMLIFRLFSQQILLLTLIEISLNCQGLNIIAIYIQQKRQNEIFLLIKAKFCQIVRTEAN